MALNEWDREVEILGHEIAHVQASLGRGKVTSPRPMTAKKFNTIQSQINFSTCLERIVALAKRQFFLLPREKTLVHWAAAYALKLHRYHEEKAKLTAKMMWVKLIQTRLAGTDANAELALETDELVDLAIRHTELSKTERHLKEALDAVKQRQSELTLQYNHLGIAAANHAASGSLRMRLGIDVKDAMESPSSRALAGFLRSLYAESKPGPREDEWTHKVRQEFTTETTGLMALCRSLVLSRFAPRRAEKSVQSARRFKAAVRKLNDLEHKSRTADAPPASRTIPPQAKPVVVPEEKIPVKN